MGKGWGRQEEWRKQGSNSNGGGGGRAPRIGLLVYANECIIFPHRTTKKKTSAPTPDDTDEGGDTKEEEEETAVSLMTNVHDPFCPLPIDE